MADTLPVSLQLMLYAQILALAVAIPMGVLTAYRAGSWLDKGSNSIAFAAIAIPNFALGLLLSYYVGVKLGWLPFQGYTPLPGGPGRSTSGRWRCPPSPWQWARSRSTCGCCAAT